MDILNKIFGDERAIARQELMRKLEGVDFQAAAENIAYTLREAAREAGSKGGHYIAKQEFIDAADHYMEKPCLDRAIILLEKYPSWLDLFELTKDTLQAGQEILKNLTNKFPP